MHPFASVRSLMRREQTSAVRHAGAACTICFELGGRTNRELMDRFPRGRFHCAPTLTIQQFRVRPVRTRFQRLDLEAPPFRPAVTVHKLTTTTEVHLELSTTTSP